MWLLHTVYHGAQDLPEAALPPGWWELPPGGARIPGSLQAAEGVDEKEVSGPDRFSLNSPKLRHGRYPESLLSGAQREAIEQIVLSTS